VADGQVARQIDVEAGSGLAAGESASASERDLRDLPAETDRDYIERN
jgi:hypothetical protein